MSGSVFATTGQNTLALENELVKVTEAELRVITKALLKSGQLRKSGLSAENVENSAKNFMLYKALAEQAQKLNLDESAEAQKLVEMNKHNVLAMLYLSDYLENLELPDFENIALENYTLNKKQFMRPETVNAQHILIHFGDSEENSQRIAQDVRAKVVQAKQVFSELAKEYSNDPSAEKNGGNLGFFDKKQMAPEFSDAAFSLKVGDVSEPVKSQFGWHIIQVLDKKPAKQLEFSEVKNKLINNAEQSFKQEARNTKLRETVYTSNLKVNEELIKKVTNDLLSE